MSKDRDRWIGLGSRRKRGGEAQRGIVQPVTDSEKRLALQSSRRFLDYFYSVLPQDATTNNSFYSRGFRFETQEFSLQRYLRQDKPMSFSAHWKTLRGPQYAAYQDLNMRYVGVVTETNSASREEENYYLYEIHQPGGELDKCGLIVAATLVQTTEKHQINRGDPDDESAKTVKSAAQALFAEAAQAGDEKVEKLAESVAEQTEMVETGPKRKRSYRVLTAEDVASLLERVSSTVENGENIWDEGASRNDE